MTIPARQRTIYALRLLAGWALLAALATGCSPQGNAAKSASRTASSPEAEAAATTPSLLIDAEPQELAAVIQRPGSRVTLVNVWASWCKPCVEEFPELLMVEHAYRDSGLRVVLVSADFERSDADSFLTAHSVPFDSYFKTGTDADFIDVLDPKWSGALPATFVFDANGVRRASWEGKRDYVAFEKAVLAAMTPASKTPTP